MGIAGRVVVREERDIKQAPILGTAIQSSIPAQSVQQRGVYGKCF